MPDWVWYPVLIIGLILIVMIFPTIIQIVKKRGITINSKKLDTTIIIPAEAYKQDTKLARELSCLIENLPRIRSLKRSVFLTYLKNKIMAEKNMSEEQALRILTTNADFKFYEQCLNSIVWSGNGINSIKTIIENEILSIGYRTYIDCKEKMPERAQLWFKNYIEQVTLMIEESNNTYLMRNYTNIQTDESGNILTRFIISEEINKLDVLHRDELKKIVEDIFNGIVEEALKFD